MSDPEVERRTENTRPDLTRRLDRVLSFAAAAIRFDYASVRLVDGGRLHVQASYPSEPSRVGANRDFDFVLTEELCRQVMHTRSTVKSGDVAAESRTTSGQKNRPADSPARSFLGIPLRLDEDVVGVLEFISRRPAFFQEEGLAQAEVVAEQIVLTIGYDRLKRKCRLLADRQACLMEGLAGIRSTPDIEQLAGRVAEQACTLVDATDAAFGLVENGRLVFRQDPKLDHWAPPALRQELGRRLVTAAGPENAERFPDVPSALTGEPAGPVLSVPVHDSRNEPLGLLLVHRGPGDRPFDESERALLAILAAQAAIVFENSRLRSEANERRGEIRTLKEFSDHLIEIIPTGIAVLDRENRFTKVNSAYCQIVGRTAPELLAQQLTQVFPEVNETEMLNLLHRVWQHGETVIASDYHYPYLAEGTAWVDLSLVPIVGRSGTVEAAMLVITDITGRKHLEAGLRLRNEMIQRQLVRHRALYEVGAQVNAELDLAQVLEAIMVSIRLVFGTDGLCIYMPQTKDSSRFECVSAMGLSDRYLEVAERSFVESAGGMAIRQRSPMVITNIAQDPRIEPLREAAIEEGFCTLLLLPFVYREEVVGLMGLYHKRPHDYSLEEMELLAIFASQATAAIKNAQLHQSVLQSTVNLNAILESITYGVIAFNREDRVIFTNRRFHELLDFDPDVTLVGKTTEELLEMVASRADTSLTAEALSAAAGSAEGRSVIRSDTPPSSWRLSQIPSSTRGVVRSAGWCSFTTSPRYAETSGSRMRLSRSSATSCGPR